MSKLHKQVQREGWGGVLSRGKSLAATDSKTWERMMLCAVNGQRSAQRSWHAKAEEAKAVCVDQTVEGEPHLKAEI